MLVGRSAELDRIDALLAAARAGEAGALVLRGEPGIGKTALLEAASARADGFRVLRAVGVESEAELACAGLHELLRPLLSQIDELPAPQAAALRAALAIDTTAGTDRFAVYVGTLGLLAAAAEREPLLCLIEDAHWLDIVSAEAILFAARRLHAEPVAIVFAARNGERRFVADGVPELQLEPLDGDASARLLASVAVDVPPQGAATLLQLARGNPLALLELPRSLSDLRLADAAAGEPVPLTRALEAAFLARTRALSDEARRALLVAAAAGSAGLGARHRDEELMGALEEAETAGLVRVDRATVAFRHPLVRSAVYHAAAGSERRRAHAALAAALPSSAADERAWHLAAAATEPDEQVAGLLIEVATRAGRRGAMVARARALIRSAGLTDDRHTRCTTLVEAANAAFAGGQAGLARSALDDASPLAGDELLLADVALARWHVQGTDWAALQAAFVSAAESVASIDPSRAARMFAYAGDYFWAAGRIDESARVIERAWGLLGERVIPGFLGIAGDRAWLYLTQGRPDDAVQLTLQALDAAHLSDERDDLDDLGVTAAVLAFVEHESARERIEELVRRMRLSGTLPGLASALLALIYLELREGRPHAAYAAALESSAIGDMLGGWAAWWGLGHLAFVEGTLGRRDECVEHAGMASRVSPADIRLERPEAAALGLAALARGELEAAHRELREAVERMPPTSLDWFGPPIRTDLAEVLLRLGAEAEAIAILDSFERSQVDRPAALASARRCRVLAAAEADLDAVAAVALAAIDGRWPFEEARTRLVFGERLRRAGRRVDARVQLEAAQAVFAGLGADAWADYARRELAASGATLRAREPSTADVLTPQERQVALIVAEGRTNREVAAALFISPKTVELHLSRVYRKLGIRSRTELARLQATEPARLTGA